MMMCRIPGQGKKTLPELQAQKKGNDGNSYGI